jgi:hypothetical protein
VASFRQVIAVTENLMTGDAIMRVVGRLPELRGGGIVKTPVADGVAIGSSQRVRSRRI